MKFIAVKFFFETTLPGACGVIGNGGRRSAFSTVQGAQVGRRPPTRNRPASRLSPLPPAVTAAPSAATPVAATPVAAASLQSALDTASPVLTSCTPASATDVNDVPNLPPFPDSDSSLVQHNSDYLKNDDNEDGKSFDENEEAEGQINWFVLKSYRRR